jgi:hypothetical protein
MGRSKVVQTIDARLQVARRQVRIAHGGFDILMAQQLLDHFQRDALHHQV